MLIMLLTTNRNKHLFLVFLLLLLAVADIVFGFEKIPLSDIFRTIFDSNENADSLIIKSYRIPKMLTALFVGATVSVSGLILQTLFRNPLADAHILGVSSGASLGVALAIMTGFQLSNESGYIIFAFLGAGLVLLLLLSVSARVKQVATLLIIGVLTASVLSAVIAILQSFTSADNLQKFVFWSMGSLNTLAYTELSMFIPITVIVFIVVYLFSRSFDVLLLGEHEARSLGLNISMIRFVIILFTALLAGITTAFVGPIGFVGMIVPHISRMYFKRATHSVLIPGTALLGAVVMIFADILTQISGFVIPINALTSLLGIPIIIVVILKNNV